LVDKFGALRLMIHEAAHQDGLDGEVSHIYKVEDLWTRAIQYVWDSRSFLLLE
jgi:hypothetical protein